MRYRRFGALVCASLVVAACGGDPSPSALPSTGVEPTPTASPTVTEPPVNVEDLLFGVAYEPRVGRSGGSVVIGDWQAVANLNGYYDRSFATAQTLAATMRGLWVTSADGHWKPDLATKVPRFSDGSIRQNPDGSFEVDLELRPGVSWSDGTALTLNDLRYTWQWNIHPDQVGLATGTVGWEDISDITVSSDGLSATVAFDKPYAGFYGLLGNPILPEHYFRDIPIAAAVTMSMPVSPAIADVPTSGPYRFTNASPNGVELTRNEHWVGGAFDQGSYLDAVSYQYFADKDGMIAAFLAGTLDVALNLTAADDARIQEVEPSIGVPITEPAWEFEHLDMNQGPNGHPMLADVNVRLAIAAAIDRADLYATLFPGYPVPEQGVCSPAPPGTYWRDADLECPGYDVERATLLLEASGWVDSNGDGTIDRDGREAVLNGCTNSGNTTRRTAAEKIAAYLGEIGIAVNFRYVDATSTFLAGWNDTTPETECSIYRGSYDVALFAWILSFEVFGNLFYPYHSAHWPDNEPHDGGNTSRFSHPAMDDALAVLRDSIAIEDQLEAARTVQRIYVEQVAEIPLYYRHSTRGASARLRNFFPNPASASDMWNIEDWWIAE